MADRDLRLPVGVGVLVLLVGYAVLGWLLIAGFIVVVFNIIADLLYAALDPRIRYE